MKLHQLNTRWLILAVTWKVSINAKKLIGSTNSSIYCCSSQFTLLSTIVYSCFQLQEHSTSSFEPLFEQYLEIRMKHDAFEFGVLNGEKNQIFIEILK